MSATPTIPILLFSAGPARADVRAALEQTGYALQVRSLNEPALGNGRPAQLLVVDGAVQPEQAFRLCLRLRTLQEETFVPILFLTHDDAVPARLASLRNGADTYTVRPFDPAELLAQAQALLRIKDRHDQLSARAAEVHRVNKRLQAAYQQIDQELVLARRIQESFLPQALPHLPRLRFAVKYRPCGHVGGDFYDVFRLDEQHVGLYVADAMGHGVPASLLTIFVKKGVRAKEITDHSYRLVPPQEVLQRLNRDLIEQALSDAPFITMVYVLFNHVEGTLQFSRAGHPYPLYVPAEGPLHLWQIEGGLLGVFEMQYRLKIEQMRPGDKVLLYTDGMDAAAFGAHPVGLPSLLAAAEHFRALPIDALVERLAQDLFTQTQQNDDLTILGMEIVDI
jgi:phosphoserine phosphatase RsbU/P